jgi:protein-ribulosamine 3-kinase
MMEGSFESEKICNKYAPRHVPKPIAWGSYKSDPDMWFLLSDFREMVEEVPDVREFVSIVVKIHNESAGKAPEGKFGFQVPTHLGYIANNNSWQTSWEAWFTNAMLRMFDEEERSHGNDNTQEELEVLKKSLLEKVIPRLLRPLESNGRTVVPCLIHSDLWLGNIMVDANTDEIVIFDSCAYWGHNESDLGVWRAPRYRLGQPYLREYQKQMGQSAPKEDWDDRNALYAM